MCLDIECVHNIQLRIFKYIHCYHTSLKLITPLNAELNPISHLVALLGAYHILHISRVGVNVYTIYLRMCPEIYLYFDVSLTVHHSIDLFQ